MAVKSIDIGLPLLGHICDIGKGKGAAAPCILHHIKLRTNDFYFDIALNRFLAVIMRGGEECGHVLDRPHVKGIEQAFAVFFQYGLRLGQFLNVNLAISFHMVDEEFPVAIGHEDIANAQGADDDRDIAQKEQYPVHRARVKFKFQRVQPQATDRQTKIFAVEYQRDERDEDVNLQQRNNGDDSANRHTRAGQSVRRATRMGHAEAENQSPDKQEKRHEIE